MYWDTFAHLCAYHVANLIKRSWLRDTAVGSPRVTTNLIDRVAERRVSLENTPQQIYTLGANEVWCRVVGCHNFFVSIEHEGKEERIKLFCAVRIWRTQIINYSMGFCGLAFLFLLLQPFTKVQIFLEGLQNLKNHPTFMSLQSNVK